MKSLLLATLSHANLILPLYLGVVFLLNVQGIWNRNRYLIGIYIAFRMLHSVIHIAGLDPRFPFLA